MKKYIQDFNVYMSENQIEQDAGLDWTMKYLGLKNELQFTRYTVKSDYINSRDLYAKGIGDVLHSEDALFSISEESNPSINQRSDAAQEKIEEIFQTLYRSEVKAPDHINHVSCTHYQSPSAAQRMVIAKEWFDSTPVTHLYHMGCYAALPAIRVSKAYVADGSQKVDIVHTELCSYHLDKGDTSAEQIVMNTLFADGAIKYSVTSETLFHENKRDGFEIIAQKELVLPGSDKEMSWKVGANGFIMTLTRSVPLILAKKIEAFMREIFAQANLDFEKDKDDVTFAVHPGGPKIIDLVERVLKLTPQQVEHSKYILRKRGNMSSATLPHIWNEILEDQNIKDNTYIATVAFGPGLTMTGAVLKLCRH